MSSMGGKFKGGFGKGSSPSKRRDSLDLSASATPPSPSPSVSVSVSASVSGNFEITSTEYFSGELVLKYGSMKKQGSLRKQHWSMKVFRLFATSLRYYKDAVTVKPRKVISLTEATVGVSDRKPFAFFVANPDIVLNIHPSSKEDRDAWMIAIKGVIRSPFADVVDKPKAELSVKDRGEIARPKDKDRDVKLGLSVGVKVGGSSSSSTSSSSDDGEKNPVEITGATLKEGYLLKQTKGEKWKKMWIVLKAAGFNIYSSNEKLKLKSALAFSGPIATGVLLQKTYSFWVQTGTQKLTLQATTAEEQDHWTSAIQNLMRK